MNWALSFFISQVIITHQLTFLPVNQTVLDSHDKGSGFPSGFSIGLSTDDDPNMEWVDQSSSVGFAIVLSTGDGRDMEWVD
jgi:hypothetical protein